MCFTPRSNCAYTVYLKVTVIPVNCTILGQHISISSTFWNFSLGESSFEMIDDYYEKKKVSFFEKILVDKQ